MNASLTSQCISSRRVSAGSAFLQVDHNPCSFVSARRSGEHGAVGGGRSRSTPEGHTAWPSSASRSIMLQSRLWSSLRPVTSAHSKLRARTPPALHHCLAEAVVINFCPAGVSRQFFMHRQSASRCCYAEPPFQSASGAGSTVAGRRRGNRCAAAAPPQPICVRSLTSCCLHAVQERSRDLLRSIQRSRALRWPTVQPTHAGVRLVGVRGRSEERGRHDRVESTWPVKAILYTCARTVARDHCGARGSS